jgi:hypothetical protein
MNEDLDREEVVGAIDRLVADLLERAGIGEPPVDAIALAQKQLGMDIRPGRPRRTRAPQSAGPPQIVLDPDQSEERRQWAVAQAIGEHLKRSLLDRLGVPPERSRALAGESLANLFAYRLLVPSRWFAADAPALHYDVPDLKERYRTSSHEVIAWRFLDLPEPCIVTVLDNDHITRRRSNAWPVRRRLEPAEQECQRYVHHYSRSKVVRAAGWTVQGWPVHQADWKREILRSVVEGEW